MLFTAPCCHKLKDALEQGDTRMFDLVGEPRSVLMLATSYSRQEHEGQMVRAWVTSRFCFVRFVAYSFRPRKRLMSGGERMRSNHTLPPLEQSESLRKECGSVV